MRSKQFYKQFLINHEHKFIYCYVPKVACSSLKLWFLRRAGIAAQDAVPSIHIHIEKNFTLATLPRREADELLRSSDYYRFAFMRNPFARLVSGYLNKIVDPEGAGLYAMKSVRKGRPWQLQKRLSYEWLKLKTGSGIDRQQGITFREFLHHVTRQSPKRLNPHWRPQTHILGDVPMDFVGLMENMTEDFAQVCQQIDLVNDLQMTNRSRKRAYDGPLQVCADWTATQHRELSVYPPFECFYTPELTERFLRVYQQDLTAFERLSAEDRYNRAAVDRPVAA